MKVLLLNGSSHADGCTAAALREVASTLECEGVETEILHVVGQPIRGCTACRRCKEVPGRCAFDDDLVNRVLEKMERADGLVIGSPVYYASANGALISLLNKYLGISGMIQVPSCYWNMVHGMNKEEVVRDSEGMRNMRELGRNMAWLLRVLETAGKTIPLPEQEPPVRTNFIR